MDALKCYVIGPTSPTTLWWEEQYLKNNTAGLDWTLIFFRSTFTEVHSSKYDAGLLLAPLLLLTPAVLTAEHCAACFPSTFLFFYHQVGSSLFVFCCFCYDVCVVMGLL